MRIDASGNVGIGITTVAAELHVNETNAAGLAGRILIQNASSNSGTFCQLILAPTAATAATRCVVIQAENTDGNNNQAIVFKTSAGGSPAERVRIDSSGNLLVGQTSLNYNAAGASMGSGGLIRAAVEGGLVLALNRRASDGQIINFYKDGSSVGSISTNANSLPSDRNFKRDISDLDLGLNLVTKLKPSQFRYKISDEDSPIMYGLIAQDLEESLTEVGIEKNSTWLLQHKPNDDEKESDYDLDYLKLTPVLINAIQEQQEQIEALQSEINTLKGG